jgi:hypothetical protein
MKKINSIFCVLIAGFLITSCQKENLDSLKNRDAATSTSSARSSVDQTKNLERVALALAKTMSEKQVRETLKQAALKQFDGDYDVLYADIRNAAFSDGQTLNQKLAKAENTSAGEIDGLASFSKRVQISVPVNCEEWNTDDFQPLVAVSPVGVAEKDLATVKAFDANGNVHLLDAKETPKVPVIVVGLSERVDEDGILKPGVKPVKQSTKSGRVNGDAEYMYWIKCPVLKDIESWTLGKPELRAMFISAKNPTLVVVDQYFYPPSRGSVDNTWWLIDGGTPRFLFSWYTEDLGNYMIYHWLEDDDAGEKQTINQSYTYKDDATGVTNTTSYSFEKQSQDVDCGRMMVNFREGNIDYNTGRITFADYY